ncbi:MAG: YHS domain-containing protein [Armatimonadetes bacterium]|nr:YHS domain-containing protein [Armatimonadota bacterium]
MATVSAFAQSDAKPAVKAEIKKAPVIHCAVMHDALDVDKATKAGRYTDYKGNRYFFCCGGCKPAFDKDPAKFAAKADHIPTPKPAKK